MSDDEDSPVVKRYKRETTSDLDISPVLTDSYQENSFQETKIFNDPIHGSIELHWLLVKLIDTPQFQRLRRLKQLGLAYYVYPGACHQRFEHSIGTCYLAGELLSQLRQRQTELNITSKDVLCVQIAALCHDLGHGPYSHMFERVIAAIRPEIHWKHELASIQMFDYMIEKNKLMPFFEQVGLDETDRIFIKELIFGELNGLTDNQIWPYKGRDITKSFLYEIVSNKLTGIDVDKFDYFARDSYYLGTKISFEHMRFFKFYRVIEVEDGKRHLCLRDKEVKACYEIYRIRDDLHRRAYQHPVVKGIELMYQEAFIIANDYLFFANASGKCDIRLAYTVDDMYTFNQIDDHITTLIKHSHHPNMDRAKEIINKIEQREIYRYIGNTHVPFFVEFKQKAYKDACQEILKHCQFDENEVHITANDLVIQTVELTCGDRGEDPLRNMLFYTKERQNKATKISKEQVSTLLPQTFREYEFRLYCKNRDSTICSFIRCGFKEYCVAKQYTTPKGSDQWMPHLSPNIPLWTSSPNVTDLHAFLIIMSKNSKNQKSITSFFKNPGQSSANDQSTSKTKPSPVVEVKKEKDEEDIPKLPSSSPPPGPPPAAIPSAKLVLSPKKPAVIVCPTIQKQPTHEMEWINLSDRFILTNRNFDVQYAHLYAERLGMMRKMVTKAAENHWDSKIPIKKMNDIVLDEDCILVGILFKQMVLKPSIVKQLATENGYNLQPPRQRYVDPTDKLILEEESQRIVLDGNIDVNQLVTGIVVAVHGHEDEKGVFIVKDYCFKELSVPKILSPPKEDKYIFFASGFLLSETSIIFNQLEYLVNSLTQSTNIQSKQLKSILSNTIRFVVAGNLIENSNRLKDTTNQAKYLTRKLTANSVEAMHSIDELFDKIAAITDIDIMPGVNDPSCHMLPQQPLHPCMFPSSSKRKTTHCLTNPYDFQIGDLRLLGTSGQNLDDIDLQSTIDNRVQILENCLQWSVVAPTCPDTLSCYPYVKNDPFIINDTPHVFFAGNQPKYETHLYQGPKDIQVRLICIPSFAQSNSCVAMNLHTLECYEISFQNEIPEIIQ